MKDLLDVNVLLALAWPNHISHEAAHLWMQSRNTKGFVTCPITENGFIRLSLNPTVVSEVVSLKSVMEIVKTFKELKGHEFWPDSLDAVKAFENYNVLSNRQVTDAYLLALAKKNNGRLVSFDRGIINLVKTYPCNELLILE